ncbi:TIGR02206 family membrane protein [Corynebacterium frankenforstense]|uniref:YwaF family protein n=1 Tax=Corynebacterium frankenforstense TaxID=1230998 RepID=UPI0026F369B6|nr:TIGR02206 family membrane protein [Corynebacterium frankenforstense]
MSNATRTWTSRRTGETYPVIEQFDRRHLCVMVVGISLAGVLVVAAKRTRGMKANKIARQLTALVLGVLSVTYLAVILRRENFVADELAPFHVSDWLRLIAPVALGTGQEHLTAITYYWGFLLNPMALLTPDAAWVMDRRIQESAYWLFHWAALIIPAVLTFGYGFRPTWSGYRFTMAFSVVWMAVAGAANVCTGGNYGFLARKPRGRSIIDIFGPWPYYIGVEFLLVAVAWAGMTWIWERRPAGGLSRRGLMRRA